MADYWVSQLQHIHQILMNNWPNNLHQLLMSNYSNAMFVTVLWIYRLKA